MESYLGVKGYTIHKSEMTVQEQIDLRENLMAKPYAPTHLGGTSPFPVYRESGNKFYIPRHYGVDRYGEPSESKLPPGDDISLDFKGDLRPYQTKIVDTYLSTLSAGKGGGLLEVPCGRGKTVIALNIIAQLKKKTLIIVHKGFLLNQWIERIETFLPDAKVGKVQGPVIDIDGKDIVIGMLQSLSMKEYPRDQWQSFGLTVVDECHHIGAEVFIRSLFKIVTPMTLGLSATMQRKDGLSCIFKYFLGDVVYKEKREGTDNVVVRAITYYNNDEEFSETKIDFRGNPQYSTMISKLCNFNRRSEFILKILGDLLSENPEQQIMILAHNKSLLSYFDAAIKHKELCDCGFYIGGMKEAALKKTEGNKVILATYAMAAEALDIKTLTTLIMASPKTDVTQSIGRILRTKDHNPLVIDIVDQHEIFQRQWFKRRAFYKKEKYEVWASDSDRYAGVDTKWEVLPAKGTRSRSEPESMLGKCLISLKKGEP